MRTAACQTGTVPTPTEVRRSEDWRTSAELRRTMLEPKGRGRGGLVGGKVVGRGDGVEGKGGGGRREGR